MKVTVRCANCNQIIRRSGCYRVKLLGIVSEVHVERGILDSVEKTVWKDVEEKIWLCKPCAFRAGYKERGKKKK